MLLVQVVITAVMQVAIARTAITEEKIFRRGKLVNKISLPTGRITEENIRAKLIVLIIPVMQAVLIIQQILTVPIVRPEKTATKKKIAIKEAHIPIRMGD